MSARIIVVTTLIGLGLGLTGMLCGCPPIAPPPDGGDNDNGGTTPPPTTKTLHEKIFTEVLPAGYQGPQDCQTCHSDIGLALLSTGHWQQLGTSVNVVGQETGTHGKRDLINNSTLAVPSNEARCAQCHPSVGWKDKTFDFNSTAQIDCLICHDTTGTYGKHPTANGGGGAPALLINGVLTAVGPDQLQTVVYNVGTPTRANCGSCHFYADGGDGVKRADLSSVMRSPTRDVDVHMGGLQFQCQQCHTFKDHGFAGFSLHSVDEGGASPDCIRCHTDQPHNGAAGGVGQVANFHTARVACQTCHIPAFARTQPTRMEWYWSAAGDATRVPQTDANGQPDYDKDRGSFVSGKNIRPTYRWFNGKWKRMIVNVSDTYTVAATAADPIVLAEPAGDINDPTAKIYPFKMLIGDQPTDPINKRVVVPHLFGAAAGPNAYWTKYDWGLAISEGTAYAGQPYSGTYSFGRTRMYLQLNHEIAPKEQVLQCTDCHGVPGFFESLGYSYDPFSP